MVYNIGGEEKHIHDIAYVMGHGPRRCPFSFLDSMVISYVPEARVSKVPEFVSAMEDVSVRSNDRQKRGVQSIA